MPVALTHPCFLNMRVFSFLDLGAQGIHIDPIKQHDIRVVSTIYSLKLVVAQPQTRGPESRVLRF